MSATGPPITTPAICTHCGTVENKNRNSCPANAVVPAIFDDAPPA
jgi:hypothetical protein